MNYQLIYYSDFKDIEDNDIRVEIYKDGSEREAEELTLSTPAVTIDYMADSIFQPLKKSGASINILTENVLENLFTGELLSPQVRIYKDGDLFWFGYITPNIYTQPYKDTLDLLTLECVDSISNLGSVDFRKSGEITSLIAIISRLLDMVDSEKLASKIYIPKSVSLDGNTDILGNLYIQERNFYDEKNEAEKADEVVGSIMQYLGFTMMQYKDAYYIIDPDSISGNTSFLVYDRETGTTSNETLDLSARNVMDIGIAKGTGTVSLGGVYNKVTLIANNNPLSAILPDFDNEDDIVNQSSNPDQSYTESYSFNDINYELLSGFFKSQSNWIYKKPSTADISGEHDIDEVTLSNRDTIKSGVFWQKVDSWETNEGEEHSSVSWKTYITMTGGGFLGSNPFLILNNTKPMILDGGYLIVNIKYKFSTDLRAHSVVKSMYDHPNVYGSCTGLTWNSDSDNIGADMWPDNTMFPCRMTIGNYYYNGEEWIDYSVYNAKVARGYYTMGADNIHGYTLHGGKGSTNKTGDWENWYRIQNAYGDWLYVTKTEYDANTGIKETGKTKRNNHFWYVNGNGDTVQMCIDYYYEIILGDRFYLVHRNKTTENIYDVEYTLTNTVSYKMNIVDSSDGVAIKCPTDKTLYGRLTFQINAPDKLGINPQYRSDIASTTLKAIHISDLTIKYSKAYSYNSIYSTSTAEPDVTYTNEINSGYCQEMEDVTLTVNSYTELATSYSYVMGLDGNNYYYIKNGLRFGNSTMIPEEKLVERYVNYYSSPKYKYGNTLRNVDVTPFSLISESNLGKTMVVGKASYDLSNNCVEIEGLQL